MTYLEELKERFAKAGGENAESRRIRLLHAAKDFIAEKKEELHRMHFGGAGGAAVVTRYTALVDSLVKAVYDIAREGKTVRTPHALVALGGYGRGELCLYSDLDIMFLHKGRLDKELEGLNDYVLYFLWDLGFKVGHSIRSRGESLKLAKLDDTVLTSMLESRLLAGDGSTFDSFMDMLIAQIRSDGIKRFIRRKKRERSRNYREAGAEIYQGEPNIKQTAGGLRDYHTGIWVALARFRLKTPRELFSAGLLTEEQFLKLKRALDFVWRIRNQMHFENGAPEDVLTLSRQERIAHAFGYRASGGALAVELFMQDYYAHASELHRFYEEMLGLVRPSEHARGGKIERGLRIAHRQVYLPARDTNWFRENPARLLELVWYAQKHGFALSESAVSRMKENLDLIDERFRQSPVARDYFMAMLSDLPRVGSTLRLMSDIGMLERYLPEFAAVRNLVRYHPFHQYPVDEHTLRALENLAEIPHLRELGTSALKGILSEIEAPELLSLAILLHDLGKAREGSHVEEGVRLAMTVGERLGLSRSQVQTLRFLIRNHLKMMHLSQYRDIDDAAIIRSFASEVGSEQELNMLYVLTFADLYAVRQGEWNDWKSALLFRLYNRTRQMLAHPAAFEREQSEYWSTPKARAICEYSPQADFSAVRKHLKLMSARYLAAFSPQEIAEHIRLVASLGRKKAVFKCTPVPHYLVSQVTVCAKDRPGLLADIVGTFASQQLSVLTASVFTRSDGLAIDSFYVVDGKTDGPLASTKWALVKENLRKVMRGEREVAELIRRAERSPRAAQMRMASLRRGVYFDNTVSGTHTVIDVEAPDRIGLLYDIASTLFRWGVDISVAKVATDARQARDAFYVTDREGNKILEPLRIREISRKIEEVIGIGHEPASADNAERSQPQGEAEDEERRSVRTG